MKASGIPSPGIKGGGRVHKKVKTPNKEGVSRNASSKEVKDTDDVRANDAIHDSATVGANVADKFSDSPLFEKINALMAGALVSSGLKKMYSGVKHKDRVEFLRGSKQLMWGAYHGLHSVETVFKVALSVTPGLRFIGGLVNADLGLIALKKDYKDDKKFDKDRAIFHSAAAAWGFRHMALGVEGLSKTKTAAKLLAKNNPISKGIASTMPYMGAAASVLGIGGGVLDAALGARLIHKGIKSGDKEKKILGSLDVTAGVAMGVSCILTGLPGILVSGLGGAALVYRTWRTDKSTIKKYWKMTKDKTKEIGTKIKNTAKSVLGLKRKTKKAASVKKA